MDEWMTYAEVAEHLRVTRQTVRNMVKRGDLLAYKVGWSVRFNRADVQRLITPVVGE